MRKDELRKMSVEKFLQNVDVEMLIKTIQEKYKSQYSNDILSLYNIINHIQDCASSWVGGLKMSTVRNYAECENNIIKKYDTFERYVFSNISEKLDYDAAFYAITGRIPTSTPYRALSEAEEIFADNKDEIAKIANKIIERVKLNFPNSSMIHYLLQTNDFSSYIYNCIQYYVESPIDAIKKHLYDEISAPIKILS